MDQWTDMKQMNEFSNVVKPPLLPTATSINKVAELRSKYLDNKPSKEIKNQF